MNAHPIPIFSPPPDRTTEGTTVRVRSRDTGGAFCVCEMTTLPGEGVPRHVHDRDEELYYVIEGTLEMEAGERRFVAEAGAVVLIPPHVPHRFRNAGDVPARALVVFRPGGFDELTDELRQARAAGVLDATRRAALLAKRGIELLDDDA